MFSGDSGNVVRSDGTKAENTSHQGNSQENGNCISFLLRMTLAAATGHPFLRGHFEISPQILPAYVFF